MDIPLEVFLTWLEILIMNYMTAKIVQMQSSVIRYTHTHRFLYFALFVLTAQTAHILLSRVQWGLVLQLAAGKEPFWIWDILDMGYFWIFGYFI